MAVTFDKAVVNQIQQANDIVELISEHVSLAKKGKEMVGLCPFHEDHRPSLYVNDTKQIFKCFACGAGGDVFKFVQMRENLSFPQAIERLAERAGIKLKPSTFARDRSGTQTPDADPNKLAKANAWAAKCFQRNLADEQKGKYVRNYITERQITQESVSKWQLGLAGSNDELVKQAKAQNIPMGLLAAAGLVISQKAVGGFGDKFVNRLMFPISDVTGRVIGFGGRILEGEGAKYINSPTTPLFDKSNSMYGLEQARLRIVSSETAVVVEGYTDCIMAHQFGCTNVVATLGTSFTAGHARILRRYAKKIVLLFDSDVAGLEASNRALEVCLAQRIDIELASVPEGKDPCDFLLAAGREKFEELVDNATDVFRFKWDRLLEKFGSTDSLMDNKAAIEEFLQTTATAIRAGNLSAIDKGLIVNRLSNIIGLETKEINAELSKRISRVERAASYTDRIGAEGRKATVVDLGSGLHASAQQEVLEILLNEPKLFETVRQKIAANVFDVPILGQIATIVFETLSAKPQASLAEILAGAESVELGNVIVELAQSGEQKGNYQPRLTGALDALGRYQTQKRKMDIKTTDDQTRFLQRVYENTEKQNPHNPGML